MIIYISDASTLLGINAIIMQTYGTIHQHEFALTLKICTSA